MIRVLFTYVDAKLPDERWQSLLSNVPDPIQHRITRYVRWQDRQAGLFGKLLLWQGLTDAAYPRDCLERLAYTAHGKPFLDSHIDFNISHSGKYVICAISKEGQVGIDIEQIRKITLADFTRYMTAQEWQTIQAAPDPYEKFFDYWTKKECVLKADGRGLSIPLPDILINGETATVSNKLWFLKAVRLDVQYKCALATNIKDADFHVSQVHF